MRLFTCIKILATTLPPHHTIPHHTPLHTHVQTHTCIRSIFGGANKWGKLPVTIYNANYTAELDAADAGIADYAFDKGPGRGYRYFKGKPLYPFGHGLSYTTFQLSGCAFEEDGGSSGSSSSSTGMTLSCSLKNTGTVVGDEVVLVYHAVSDAIRANIGDKHPVPFKDLVEFERSVSISLSLYFFF